MRGCRYTKNSEKRSNVWTRRDWQK